MLLLPPLLLLLGRRAGSPGSAAAWRSRKSSAAPPSPLVNGLCNTPDIWTAYTDYDDPRYLAAFLINLAASVVAIAMAGVTLFHLRGQNRKMDQGKAFGRSGPTAVQQAAGFRYIL